MQHAEEGMQLCAPMQRLSRPPSAAAATTSSNKGCISISISICSATAAHHRLQHHRHRHHPPGLSVTARLNQERALSTLRSAQNSPATAATTKGSSLHFFNASTAAGGWGGGDDVRVGLLVQAASRSGGGGSSSVCGAEGVAKRRCGSSSSHRCGWRRGVPLTRPALALRPWRHVNCFRPQRAAVRAVLWPGGVGWGGVGVGWGGGGVRQRVMCSVGCSQPTVRALAARAAGMMLQGQKGGHPVQKGPAQAPTCNALAISASAAFVFCARVSVRTAASQSAGCLGFLRRACSKGMEQCVVRCSVQRHMC